MIPQSLEWCITRALPGDIYYFRSLNGHTQVNATEIRNVPLPDSAIIRKIGELVSRAKDLPGNLDEMIGSYLGIDAEIIKHLEGRYNGAAAFCRLRFQLA